ncbi:prephenate dehydratase [Fulvivirga ligni]|uniref:prephenate dehydratase n=1 Tax=Fulvivirga ligni TaxID=2904246 RepID=UPI001F20CA40|nr:prephenate dehydratase [Fulvivirga ligni]UII23008.1 prephenate dehydratase [Fulvivirga ligni]
MNEVLNIDDLRKKIDSIDHELLSLLNERMELVKTIGNIKQSTNASVYRPEREKAIIERLSAASTGKLDKNAIEAIFLEIFAVSRNLELPEKVAYLGPEGSFTHQAAEARFGAMGDYTPLKTIKSVFDAVATERVRFGIIPIENNQEGMVNDTIKVLCDYDINIVAEIPMPIHFSFASNCDSTKHIKKIYSKDIAFKQCGKFIDEYFDKSVELIPVDSTSKASKLASREENSAAICSHIAGKMYHLPILFQNIEDSPDNYTRFLIISRNFNNVSSGNDKTTILVKLSNDNEPGSLAGFLQGFHKNGINLTKIESYPAKEGKGFKYWFLVEFEGHKDDENISQIMNDPNIKIKWLGSYTRLC